ncbi:hypothetical protein SAMN05192533_12529 [Mesobacillus persicus]|uniref:Uncharacterized protein n=1 Tax=Mesobacillus persicus TaxID=930146 RepID=A0A1H8K8C6_9BACI|nr:hypothetical protein [Mesobacillus persicus]SEN89174.1 hypothetical protein SAMN05192533_12529 [Mesobacillus persicus]
MTTLNKKGIHKIEEYYYWVSFKSSVPFPKELKERLIEGYGEGLFLIAGPIKIFIGSRKIISNTSVTTLRNYSIIKALQDA